MVETPSGSSPTRPRARRSSRVKAVPRFRIGVASTEVPRARTRTAGPSGVVANSYGRSVMVPSWTHWEASPAGRSRHLYPERPDVSDLADADREPGDSSPPHTATRFHSRVRRTTRRQSMPEISDHAGDPVRHG